MPTSMKVWRYCHSIVAQGCSMNLFSITGGQLDYGRGVAFSPNGRFLYVSTDLDVYQFDTEADDIAASEVHIAQWDSTYSPFPPFAALFSNM